MSSPKLCIGQIRHDKLTVSRADLLTEFNTESGTAAVPPEAGRLARVERLVEADIEPPRRGKGRRILKGWNKQDWIKLCVEMGITGPMISAFSLSWPEQIAAAQTVYDNIERLGLGRKYKRSAIKKRQVGDHNAGILHSFMKVAGQFIEHGALVWDAFREEAPVPGCRFQSDWGLRADNLWFLCEYQNSPIRHTNWRQKHRNAVELYEMTGEPFRQLVLLAPNISRVRWLPTVGRLSGITGTCPLFYYMEYEQFVRCENVVSDAVWHDVWNLKKTVKLLP